MEGLTSLLTVVFNITILSSSGGNRPLLCTVYLIALFELLKALFICLWLLHEMFL